MIKFTKDIMMVLAACVMLCGFPVQAGAGSEAVKYIAKVARSVGSVTKSALDDAAQMSPVFKRLLNRYGDDAVVSLASNPRRVQLVETLGDDAAEALIKLENIAEDTLRHCPDAAVARALKDMSRDSGQYLAMCSRKHDLSPEDLKNVVLIVREGGEKTASRLSRLNPEKLEKVLHTAQVAGIAVAATMVTSAASDCSSLSDFGSNLLEILSWTWEHPVLSLILFALLVVIILRFPEITVKCLVWIPLLCWSALKVLWRVLYGLLKQIRHRSGLDNAVGK